MSHFDNIGKRLPYTESEPYLDALTQRAPDNAIAHQRAATHRNRRWLYTAAAAIALAIAATAGIMKFFMVPTTDTIQQTDGPLAEFLDGLSDDDALLLAYYDIDDLPDYDEEE